MPQKCAYLYIVSYIRNYKLELCVSSNNYWSFLKQMIVCYVGKYSFWDNDF